MRLRSKCLRMHTAFLIKWYKSSGNSGAIFSARRMRRILEPVTETTWGIPMESLSMTPIWDGVMPFLAALTISAVTDAASILHQEGGARR